MADEQTTQVPDVTPQDQHRIPDTSELTVKGYPETGSIVFDAPDLKTPQQNLFPKGVVLTIVREGILGTSLYYKILAPAQYKDKFVSHDDFHPLMV